MANTYITQHDVLKIALSLEVADDSFVPEHCSTLTIHTANDKLSIILTGEKPLEIKLPPMLITERLK